MPFAQVNGIERYFEDHEGPARDASTVVFLHGAGGNHLSWWQQIPRFRRAYRCITIDHRGYGASADPGHTGWVHYGEDLIALLDHLDVGRAALVAQSMGGRTAIDAAVRAPQRISAVVMADTWGFFRWPENAARSSAALDALQTRRAAGKPVMVAESFEDREPERLFLLSAGGRPQPAP